MATPENTTNSKLIAIVNRVTGWKTPDTPPCEEAIDTGKRKSKGLALDGTLITEPIYTVEFTSLSELLKFINKYGNIIIYQHDWDDDTFYHLTIYDDHLY